MSPNFVRAGVGAVALAALAVAPACTKSPEVEPEASVTPTTVAAPQSAARPSCQVGLPAAWQRAIDESTVDSGGVSNVPMAVGPAGEVAVSRDDGDGRDVLVIDADKKVNEVYAVPDPESNGVGSVAIDDRWVVVGVDFAPRAANGIIPTLMRIDVVDRQGGPQRTVVQSPDEDRTSGGNTIDSFALFGGKVYWITRDSYAGDTGTIRSYDLNTGAVTEMATGPMRNVRTTAAGLSWEVAWDQNAGNRAELKIPDALPPPVAGAVGTGQDQLTLATDGTAYAWFTGRDQDEPGLAYWSADSGLLHITGDIPTGGKVQAPPLYVAGPYVVIGSGRQGNTGDTSATVIDTRSGAVAYLQQQVGGANGGTIAVGAGAAGKEPPKSAGVFRVAGLPPLSC